jgi:hypothetical protein
MKKLLLLALVGAVLLSAAPVLAEDGFYVVGVRLTPGTKITSLPYIINANAPGYYYLTGNLSSGGLIGIMINADNVTLDLMGFALTGPSNNLGSGIMIIGNNVEVRNGTIRGWAGAVSTGEGNNRRIIGVRAIGNTNGINLSLNGSGNLIKGCTAIQGSFGSGQGLVITGSGTISGCTVMNFTPGNSHGNIHIGLGGTASDNLVLNCTGVGIRAVGPTTISHNSVTNCTTGIDASGGGSLIGNAVATYSGQTALHFNGTPVVADQNSFYLDPGATFSSGTFAGTWGLNGGGPPPPP